MRFKLLFAGLLLCLLGCHHASQVPSTADPVTTTQSTPLVDSSTVSTALGAPPPTTADDQAIINAVIANGTDQTPSADRAVCFGNNYDGLPAQLHECIGDARKNVLNLVKIEHFDPKNIRLFTNSECSKSNYEKWATWVLADIKSGDRRFFSSSSHGGEDTDSNGKVIDVLITWEMIANNDWSSATEVSPEFWSNLLRSTTGSFVFLNDSCHSGGQMRKALGIAALKNNRLVRSVDGPPTVQARLDKATERGISWRAAAISGSVVWACQPSELSEEDSVHGGLGTDSFWAARKKLIAENPKIGAVIQEANRILHSEYMASQHEGLSGSNKPMWSKD